VPLPRLARIVLIALLVWIVIGIVALVLFHREGAIPDRGRGDPIGLARASS
jgi:hypothetical protein